MKKTIVTREGLEKLQEELNELKTVTRVKVGNDLKKARAFGDLSENSEYDEAKNEQAKVEGRILELEEILKNVEVVEGVKTTGVGFGNTVLVEDESGEVSEYTIVGAAEANFLENKISNESPIGAAIFGKKAGDKVTFTTPGGQATLTIKKIIHNK
ncbi:MAG: transcription elongation factor GreA [Clostridia bacterium]|nr:transcription elongation factor GreA [Clostridia bacterium]